MVDEDEGNGDQWHRWEDRIKSAVIFAFGIGTGVNELFFVHNGPRPAAFPLIFGALGLPFVMDGAKRSARNGKKNGAKR